MLSYLFSLHLTIQIVLEEQLFQTQCLKLILKGKQGKVLYPVLLCCGTKCDLHEMKITELRGKKKNLCQSENFKTNEIKAQIHDLRFHGFFTAY